MGLALALALVLRGGTFFICTGAAGENGLNFFDASVNTLFRLRVIFTLSAVAFQVKLSEGRASSAAVLSGQRPNSVSCCARVQKSSLAS